MTHACAVKTWVKKQVIWMLGYPTQRLFEYWVKQPKPLRAFGLLRQCVVNI